MRLHEIAIVGNCRNGCEKLNRSNLEALTEAGNSKVDLRHLIYVIIDTAFFAGNVNARLFCQTEGLEIFGELLCTKRFTDCDKCRVA